MILNIEIFSSSNQNRLFDQIIKREIYTTHLQIKKKTYQFKLQDNDLQNYIHKKRA